MASPNHTQCIEREQVTYIGPEYRLPGDPDMYCRVHGDYFWGTDYGATQPILVAMAQVATPQRMRQNKRSQRRERCGKGHRYTALNTAWKSNGTRICLTCRKLLLKQPYKPKAPYKRRDTCKQGHLKVGDNSFIDHKGHNLCVQCKNEARRRRYRRRHGAR